MEHYKLNRIMGAIVFAISFVVYCFTVAPTTSYWDCGEFITCAHTMGVPHPPGAPLFIMIGRVVSMIPFVADIGLRINMISVLVSALTVMFTYLIVVRLLRAWKGLPETIEEKIIMYGGGIMGALAFAFTDSFWFNAVEAEVYAVSMFFTGIIVWLILVWEEKADSGQGDKILLLIAYLIGLALGVHLLNILAIPTLFLIIYFKRSELNITNFALWGAFAAAIFGTIYPGVVKGIPWMLKEYGFLSIVVAVGALLVGIVYTIQNNKRILSLLLMGMMLITISYSTYTMLYIRSGLKPAINENHPDTPKKFVSYLNREQYGDIPLDERRAPMWEYQIKKMYVRYFAWQFIGTGNTIGKDGYITETLSLRGLMGLPFLIGLIGMYYHFRHDWKRGLSVLALFVMTGIAITIYLNQENPQPRERDYAYVGSFFAFAIWIGLGASALLEFVSKNIVSNQSLRKVGFGGMGALLLFALPVNLFNHNYDTHNRSGNYVAYDYSYNILQSCEKDGILFTNGDNDTFPLWFLQYVYNIRTDVRVVNLSLLNTPWYIKQLRDEEPKIPITLSDTQIDALQARLWEKPRQMKIEVPRETILAELKKAEDNTQITLEDIGENPAVAWEMKNTKNLSGYPVILVQDIMVVHILAANKFKKPVYFAVTVAGSNMLGLDNNRGRGKGKNYLRMDGLAFRVMPYSGPTDFISHKQLEDNLFNEFKYRNLDNPDVFYNRNIKGLLQNYRSAFLRLTNYYQTMDSPDGKEKAIGVLDKMEEFIPEKVIPLTNYQLSLNFGRLYKDVGRPEELERRIDNILETTNLAPYDKMFMAQTYFHELNNMAKAESLAKSVVAENPNFVQGYSWLVSLYSQSKEYDKGIALMEEWLKKVPNDPNAMRQLSELKTLASLDSAQGKQPSSSPE